MNTADKLKCLFCGAVASMVMGSTGRYLCRECGKEVQPDEPPKTTSTSAAYSQLSRIATFVSGSSVAASGVSTTTTTYLSSSLGDKV